MPLVLAPSFDDHTREQVEQHLEIVRIRRLAAAMEYQQAKQTKLEAEGNSIANKLERNWEQLGKTLARLDRELEKAEEYVAKCTMLKTELGLVQDRIELAAR